MSLNFNIPLFGTKPIEPEGLNDHLVGRAFRESDQKIKDLRGAMMAFGYGTSALMVAREALKFMSPAEVVLLIQELEDGLPDDMPAVDRPDPDRCRFASTQEAAE